jgi:hypothetical protein
MTQRDPIMLWRTVGEDRWYVACRLCRRETLASADSAEQASLAAHHHLLQAHVSDAKDLRTEPSRAE